MHQLIYVSEARSGLSAEDLFRIVEQSARNNPSADITGFLIARGGRFLQLIEGPLMALETLLERLGEDERHHSIRVVQRLPIAERSFPRWRMKRLNGGHQAFDELETALKAEGVGKPVPDAVRNFIFEQMAA